MAKRISPEGLRMTATDNETMGKDAVLLVDVGNTTIHFAGWQNEAVHYVSSTPTDDADAFAIAFDEIARRFKHGPTLVVMGSVVPDAANRIRAFIEGRPGLKLLVVGEDIQPPIPVDVLEPNSVGIDRLCAAAAAYHFTGHACTVVDFGTAVTVDLVDDRGAFVGGAILPGAGLQSRILAEAAAALPLVEPKAPDNPIGQNTTDAIRAGLAFGIPGAVRALVERYATVLNYWPQVVATGGDLEWMLQNCSFVDSPVPNLTLIGLGLSCDRHGNAGKQ